MWSYILYVWVVPGIEPTILALQATFSTKCYRRPPFHVYGLGLTLPEVLQHLQAQVGQSFPGNLSLLSAQGDQAFRLYQGAPEGDEMDRLS